MAQSGMPVSDSAVVSDIDQVTVYRENALISRKVPIPAGSAGIVRISGLPLSLDDSSISIRSDSADRTLRILDFSIILESPEPDPELPPPTDSDLEDLRHRNRRLELQIGLVQRAIERIRSLTLNDRAAPADTSFPSPTPIAARKSMLDFMEKRMKELHEKGRSLSREKEKLGRELLDLEQWYGTVSSARQNRENELRKTVVIHLDGAAEAESELFLDYLVPGAGWYPVYSLNVSGDYSRYTLSMRAMLRQNSGEDWHDVRIKLSTAEAVRRMERPVPAARIFGRPAAPSPLTGWRKPPEGALLLLSDYDDFVRKSAPSKAAGRSLESELPPAPEEDLYDDDIYDEEEFAGGPDKMLRQEMDICADEMPLEEPMASMPSMASMASEAPPARKKSAPARMMKSSELARARRRIGGMEAEEDSDAFESELYEADSGVLDYNSMRLGAADSSDRGHLKRSSLHERYGISPEAARRIEEELARIREFGFEAPPPGCIRPVSYEGFDYAFAADCRVNVPSDGRYHTRLISCDESTGAMNYVCVPRESRDVFRYIRFPNPLDAPLLAGPVDLSIDSSYLLSSDLDTVPAGGTVKLGAGVEQSIKLSRNTLYSEESSGLIKGVLALKYQIDIDVENNLKTAADLEIRERISIASREKEEAAEKIKVEIKKVHPQWESFDQEPYYTEGIYRWKSRIDGGTKKNFSVSYEIQIPSQYELIGGNRREN